MAVVGQPQRLLEGEDQGVGLLGLVGVLDVARRAVAVASRGGSRWRWSRLHHPLWACLTWRGADRRRRGPRGLYVFTISPDRARSIAPRDVNGVKGASGRMQRDVGVGVLAAYEWRGAADRAGLYVCERPLWVRGGRLEALGVEISPSSARWLKVLLCLDRSSRLASVEMARASPTGRVTETNEAPASSATLLGDERRVADGLTACSDTLLAQPWAARGRRGESSVGCMPPSVTHAARRPALPWRAGGGGRSDSGSRASAAAGADSDRTPPATRRAPRHRREVNKLNKQLHAGRTSTPLSTFGHVHNLGISM